MSHLFRSLMFVPAHNERLLNSASRSDADVLILDIEDSVQPVSNKIVARNNIVKYISGNIFFDRPIYPRINDRESGELLKDIYALTIPGVSGFMYPKSTKGEDIYFIGKLLETVEYEKGFPIGTFKIIPLIETAGAIVNLKDICTACSRVVAVAFGCEDYVTDLRGEHDEKGESIFMARSLISACANIYPIDTVHIKVHDLEDLEKNLILSKKLGFEGMLVLNPKELPLVHRYFSPTQEEVEWAKEMLALASDSVSEGKGVAVKGDKFIGPPMVKMANNILMKQQLIREKVQ